MSAFIYFHILFQLMCSHRFTTETGRKHTTTLLPLWEKCHCCISNNNSFCSPRIMHSVKLKIKLKQIQTRYISVSSDQTEYPIDQHKLPTLGYFSVCLAALQEHIQRGNTYPAVMWGRERVLRQTLGQGPLLMKSSVGNTDLGNMWKLRFERCSTHVNKVLLLLLLLFTCKVG